MDQSASTMQPAQAGVDHATPVEAMVLEEPPVRRSIGDPPAGHLRAIAGEPAPSPGSPRPLGKTYVVPKRFGVSAILALMTILGLLFGYLRFLEMPPVVFLFLGMMVLVVSIVQMFCGHVPRLASILAGAMLSPVFVALGFAFTEARNLWELICVIWGSVFWGALAGYFTGTCAAGVFLVMERIDPYLPGGRSRAASQSIAPAPPKQGNKQ